MTFKGERVNRRVFFQRLGGSTLSMAKSQVWTQGLRGHMQAHITVPDRQEATRMASRRKGFNQLSHFLKSWGTTSVPPSVYILMESAQEANRQMNPFKQVLNPSDSLRVCRARSSFLQCSSQPWSFPWPSPRIGKRVLRKNSLLAW